MVADRVSSELNILFHVGSGKAASTWLQGQFCALPDSLYVGKKPWPGANGEAKKAVHRSLFRPFYGDAVSRSRNSLPDLRAYARLIAEDIRNAPQARNVIVSDETIGSYGFYNAELNVALLPVLVAEIESALQSQGVQDVILRPSVLFVFREQTSYLQSHYAYSYALLRKSYGSFEAYLDWGLANDHEGVFGALWYDELYGLWQTVLRDWYVRFVPYEMLKVNGEAAFLKACCEGLSFSEAGFDDVLMALQGAARPVNVNTGRASGANALRKPNLVLRAFQLASSFAVLRKLANPFKDTILRVLEPFMGVRQSRVDVLISDHHRMQWQERLAPSNRELEALTGLKLEDLGYRVAGSPGGDGP